MKPICLFSFFVLINLTFITSAYIITKSNVGGNEKSTIYNSIEEFITENPDVKLIPMEMHSNALNISRSYVLGARQTGIIRKINQKNN